MKLKMSFVFLSILFVLWGCSNDSDDVQKKSKEESDVVEQDRKEKINYEDELNTIEETINKYRNGSIEGGLASTSIKKHIANLESVDPKEKDLQPVIDSLKVVQEKMNQKDVQNISVLKDMVEVENQINKSHSNQAQEGENTMINVTKAEGLLRNSFAPIVGNVTYNVEGTVNNKEINEVVLTFSAVVDGVENIQSVTVPVNEGSFVFTKKYDEVFGYFKNIEISAKKADGTLVQDSSGNDLLIKTAIDLSTME